MAAREIPLVRRADDDVVADAQHPRLLSLAAEREPVARINRAALRSSEGHRIEEERDGKFALDRCRGDARNPILRMNGDDRQRGTQQPGCSADEEIDFVSKLFASFVAGLAGFDPMDPASGPESLEVTFPRVVEPGHERDVEPCGDEASPEIEDEGLTAAKKSLARRVERVVEKCEHPNRLSHNP